MLQILVYILKILYDENVAIKKLVYNNQLSVCAQKKRGGEIKGERERESFDRKREGKERKRKMTEYKCLPSLVS